MAGLGVVLLVLAAVAVLVGLVFYGAGVGTVPEQPMRDATATRRGVSRIAWSNLFASMKTSVKDATRSDADKGQRRASMGAFLVLVGLILVVLAILSFIVAS
ncbi:hypothetical protein [Mycolicibacterium litorale]|uniref:Uncharacterized protein n=1 Tax=Mycolicibacterium litorale TaxID=758802 RepID=A0AAD1IFF9_9MYCO|nr:hypothetical protein [Mycolicibacterium litorale]MCV7418622.1 hypothetical protein [Mycolicibacterium litorale]TDY05980.1 hypothetical protein BCL50_2291 [Mycolicibacterium litorale]BBY14514.1 hypothetical protein MLIT_01060 [Mycolicibacterium litorale]